MSAVLVERVRTTPTIAEWTASVTRAWMDLLHSVPTQAALSVLWAQFALETGRGKSCFNHNLGNIKRVPGDGHDWCILNTFEYIDGRRVDVPDTFRAYPTLDAGALDYLRFLTRTSYADPWACVVAGDADAFARALKYMGYYTAPAIEYAAGLKSLSAEYLRVATPVPSDGPNTEPQTPKSKSQPRMAAVTVPQPGPVHLPPNGETLRANAWGQAYALTETPPSVDTIDIVRWLAVERHARYRPHAGTTYCNVFAYDACNAIGAYLPRVWWTPDAVAAIQRGDAPAPKLNITVQELSANALFAWLAQWSASFGWVRSASLDEAQDAANGGRAVVICARNRNAGHSGHISVVCPETDTVTALRGESSAVKLPVQSQAGGKNYELSVMGPAAWWLAPTFAEWGIWIHEPAKSRDTLPAPPISDSFDGAATPLRAGEGEHTPITTASEDGDL